MYGNKSIWCLVATTLVVTLLLGIQVTSKDLDYAIASLPTLIPPETWRPDAETPNTPPSNQKIQKYDAAAQTVVEYERPPSPPRDTGIQVTAATSWIPVSQDVPIYEGHPNSSFSEYQTTWIGYYSGADWLRERALVQWDTYWLPENATISNANTHLWQLDYTGSPYCEIATHRLTNYWWEQETSWNSRYTSQAWNTAGGDFDTTPLATVSVYTNTEQWTWMGDVTSLVTNWHNNTYQNYGVLYKGTSESGSSNDRFFALSDYSSWQNPALGVNYTFNGSVESLPINTPQTKSTPSGDHYFSHASLADWKWRAYGIRPPTETDYDLYLYDNADFYLDWPPSVAGKFSWWGTGQVDFVAIGRAAPQEVRYARVMDWSGSGNYQVEFATSMASLSGSGTFGPYSIGSDSVLRVFEFSGTPNQNYRFTLQTTSGDADLGIMLCDPSILYANRGGCSAYADEQGAGGTEQKEYQIGDVTDGHGLIVWNNGASTSSQFSIQVEPITSRSYIYLPSVLKAYFVDPYEDNDRVSDAYGPLANNVSYYAYTYDENDYYWFNLDTSAHVTVRVTNFSATEGQLTVLNSAEIEEAKTTNQNHPTTMELTTNQLAPGKYYVRVYALGNLNTQTLYELNITW